MYSYESNMTPTTYLLYIISHLRGREAPMEISSQGWKVDQGVQENMDCLEYSGTWEKKEILGSKDKMDYRASKERLAIRVGEGWLALMEGKEARELMEEREYKGSRVFVANLVVTVVQDQMVGQEKRGLVELTELKDLLAHQEDQA